MTPTTAADKVKEIIESWESATNHAPVGEWSIDIFLKSSEGSRLVGELVEDWISVEDRLPVLVDNKMLPVLVRYLKYKDKSYHTVTYYFPDRFKTVEWEDWDDYDEEDFPYTENDKEKGVVWLRAGWYESIECEKCDGYWQPIKVTHWQPLPEPPKP